MKRDLVSFALWTPEELLEIFRLTRELQADVQRDRQPLARKTATLIFERASLRTRVSFEVGIAQLGGHPVFLQQESVGMATRESVHDIGSMVSLYTDLIIARTIRHQTCVQLAESATVPVINALTDLLHPCQVLADCFTLTQRFGDLSGKKVAWIGDGNNMANSWINASATLGFDLTLACPAGFEPDKNIMDAALADGAKVLVVRDLKEAVKGAIAVNTDVWASMGQEAEAERRKKAFQAYMVDEALMDEAGPDAVFMHCLPAHRGEEVAEEVLEGWRSIVWEQAQNRQYIQEAILEFLLRA